MKILIAPDKFKGSLTAIEVAHAIQKGIQKFDESIETILLPLADGGEGTLEVLEKVLSLKTISVQVHDPLFRLISAFYKMTSPTFLKNQETAFIEMAQASGLLLLEKNERNPMQTTSLGTGEMILDAIQKGAKKIYLFIGGSATNDAGMGMASALGYQFFDEENNVLNPVGKNLIRVKTIDMSQLKFSLEKIEVKVVCDVENILFGQRGAAQVYAAQKGASPAEIKKLEEGVKHFSKKIIQFFQQDISATEGAGAAGGLGAGAMIFLNAKMGSGIQTLLEMTAFEKQLDGVNLVITGEGKMDAQTLRGKVVKGVADICRKKSIPVIAICGDSSLDDFEIEKLGLRRLATVLNETKNLEQAMTETQKYVERIAFEMIKNFQV